jgi:hypothetical protein
MKKLPLMRGLLILCLTVLLNTNGYSQVASSNFCSIENRICSYGIYTIDFPLNNFVISDSSSCFPESAIFNHYNVISIPLIRKGGTIKFNITPNNASDDIDFLIYRGSCDDLKLVRCMAAGSNSYSPGIDCIGSTGLEGVLEGVLENEGCEYGNNNYINELQVIAGESYYVVINNFRSNQSVTFDVQGDAEFGEFSILSQTESFSKCIDEANANINIDVEGLNYTVKWYSSDYKETGFEFNANGNSAIINNTTGTKYFQAIISKAKCIDLRSNIISITQTECNGCVPPTINKIESASRCTEGPLTLRATSTGMIRWYTSMVATEPFHVGDTLHIANLTNTTTYYIESYNELCTNNIRKPITAELAGNFVAEITASKTSICLGDSIVLSVTKGDSYLWNNGKTTNSIVVKPTINSTYNVNVSKNGGCISNTSIDIEVKSPTANIWASNNINCVDSVSQLVVNGGVAYKWNTIPPQDNDTIVVKPSTTTNYMVTVTDGNGCTVVVGKLITVDKLVPIANAGLDKSINCNISTSLTATGGSTYSWSTQPSQNTASINVNPKTKTTYTVTVTSANRCTSTDEVIVNVNSLPNANISTATTSICAGKTATLNASGGVKYKWNTNDSTASIIIKPMSSQNYTVTVFNSVGCYNTKSINITVKDAPLVNVLPAEAKICIGDSLTLVASGGGSYRWTNTNLTSTYVVKPTSSKAYTVTVTATNACTSTFAKSVDVMPLPTLVLSPSTATICKGDTIQLLVNGALKYKWSTVSNDTSSIVKVSPNTTTTYIVTGKDHNGCTATSSRLVTVRALPLAKITTTVVNDTVCSGKNVVMTASGGLKYKWSTGDTLARLNFVASESKIYTVTVTANTGCTAIVSDTVAVNSSPVVLIQPDSIVLCKGKSIELTAISSGTYKWSNGILNATTTVTPTTTTTYTVTVTSAQGCTSTSSRKVYINPLPVGTILPSSVTICKGETTVLRATGGQGYVWSVSESETNDSLEVTPIATTTYTVTISDANGCTATSSRLVTVRALPLAKITTTVVNDTVCSGKNVVMTASGGVKYKWSTGDTLARLNFVASESKIYTVTVTANTGCTAIVSDTVAVNLSPVVLIQPDSIVLCKGKSIELTAISTGTYKWSNGILSSTTTVTPTTTTTYTVTVTSAQGCTSTSSRKVYINPLPVGTILPSSVTICKGETTVLRATGGQGYVWSVSESETNDSLEVTPIATTTYTVTISDANGCTATSSRLVTVRALPLAKITTTVVNDTVCSGKNVVMTASGGVKYKWSTGDTLARLNFVASESKIYTVTVTANTGCTAIASDTVHVNETPTVVIQPDNATVCKGESIDLIALSGDVSYKWSNGILSGTNKVKPNVNTIYRVTVTSAEGCTNVAQKEVKVITLPIIKISTDTTSICEGDVLDLVASGARYYNWHFNNSSDSIIHIIGDSTRTYTVTGIDSVGCSSTISKRIVVNKKPVSTITSNPNTPTICSGTNLTLTANGGTKYEWNTGEVTASFIKKMDTTTLFKVTVTNAKGCKTEVIKNITVLPSPIAYINIDSSEICRGDTLRLEASGGDTYKWNQGSASNIVNLIPTSSQTYTVTISNNNGCKITKKSYVKVNQLPVLSLVSAVNKICQGDSLYIHLKGTQYGSVVWSHTAAQDTLVCVKPLVTTTYTVVYTDQNGCTRKLTKTIQVSPLPLAIISPLGNTISLCNNKSITLTAAGGNKYRWSTQDSVSRIVVSPDVNTSYAVTVTSSAGCTAIAIKNIDVNDAPIVNIQSTADTICRGESITLNVVALGKYKWNSGDTISSISKKPTTTTTYIVTVTSANGCQSISSKTIVVNQPLVATLASTQNAICKGDNVSISVSVDGQPATFIWSTGSTSSTIIEAPNMSMVYSVTVTSEVGCSKVLSKSIVVNQLPIAKITPSKNGTICVGETISLTGSGGVSYAWSTNQNTATIQASPADTTSYAVSVTNTKGCSAIAYYTLPVKKAPVITSLPDTSTICSGQDILLLADGGISYKWSNGATTASINPTPTQTANYTVTVTALNGCSTTAVSAVIIGSTGTFATIDPPQAVECSSNAVTITVYGGHSYLWSDGSTSSELIVSSAASHTYTVTVSNTFGCTQVLTSFIERVLPPQNVVASDTISICMGDSIILNALVGFTNGYYGQYTYQWDNGSTEQHISVKPNLTQTYMVTVTNEDACEVVFTKYVDVKSPLTSNILGKLNLCTGEQGNLVATGGTQYQWNTGSTSAQIQVNTSGTYKVTVSDDNGCTAMNDVEVTVLPKIKRVGMYMHDPFCATAPGDIIAYTYESYPYDSTQFYKNVSLLWPDGSAGYNYAVQSDTAFKLRIKADNYCETSFLYKPSTNPYADDRKNRPHAGNYYDQLCDNANYIYIGNYSTLIGNGTTNDYPKFQWKAWQENNNQYYTDSPQYAQRHDYRVWEEGIYSVIILAANGCEFYDTMTVVRKPTVEASIALAHDICTQQTMATVSGGTTYQWSKGYPHIFSNLNGNLFETWPVPTTESTAVFDFTTAGESNFQAVYVHEEGKCSQRFDFTIPSKEHFIEGPSFICNSEENIEIRANAEGSYLWNTGETSQAIIPAATGWYTCTVTNSICAVVDSFYVTMVQGYEPIISLQDENAARCTGTENILLLSNIPSGALVNWYGVSNIINDTMVMVNNSTEVNANIIDNVSGCSTQAVFFYEATPSVQPIISPINHCDTFGFRILNAQDFTSINWTTPSGISGNGSLIVGDTFGNYQVTVVDNNGCEQNVGNYVNDKPRIFGTTFRQIMPYCADTVGKVRF